MKRERERQTSTSMTMSRGLSLVALCYCVVYRSTIDATGTYATRIPRCASVGASASGRQPIPAAHRIRGAKGIDNIDQ